MLDPAFVL